MEHINKVFFSLFSSWKVYTKMNIVMTGEHSKSLKKYILVKPVFLGPLAVVS